MDDVHLSTARHFRYELRLRLGGKWSAGGVPRITRRDDLRQLRAQSRVTVIVQFDNDSHEDS